MSDARGCANALAGDPVGPVWVKLQHSCLCCTCCGRYWCQWTGMKRSEAARLPRDAAVPARRPGDALERSDPRRCRVSCSHPACIECGLTRCFFSPINSVKCHSGVDPHPRCLTWECKHIVWRDWCQATFRSPWQRSHTSEGTLVINKQLVTNS